MRSGKGTWKGVPPNDRVQAVIDIVSLLADKQLQLEVYACVIEKKLFSPDNILTRSFDEVASCFDGDLKTLYKKKNPQTRLSHPRQNQLRGENPNTVLCVQARGAPRWTTPQLC